MKWLTVKDFRSVRAVNMVKKKGFSQYSSKNDFFFFFFFRQRYTSRYTTTSEMAKKSKKVPYLAQFTRKCGILQARNSLKDSIAFLENILCEAFLMLVCASITKKK